MPVTTLPTNVNTYNQALRSAVDQRFLTVNTPVPTTVNDPGSPTAFITDAVTTFQSDVYQLDTRVTSLEDTRAPKTSPVLTNAVLNVNTVANGSFVANGTFTANATITANGTTGTPGQYLASGGGNNVYWATFSVAGTPTLDAVATVGGSTTRAISISNTLAAGNTTITGSASISSTLNVSDHTRIGPYAGSSSSGNVTGLELINNGGSGDSNLAAMSFHCSGYYGTHLHLRPDGYFGVGGWSASSWRWYVNMSNGDMTAAGNVTAYSDPRLKEDITPIKSALSIVKGWNGVRYRWSNNSVIGTPGAYDYGILSPDIEKSAPELVKDSMWKTPTGDFYKTVVYDKLAPFLIESTKELDAKIIEQQATIDKMQQQIDAILAKLNNQQT